jgi:hypothetical protein
MTNRKNTMPEPKISRTKDATLASFPEFSLEKTFPWGDMDPFGIFIGSRPIFRANPSNWESYGWV